MNILQSPISFCNCYLSILLHNSSMASSCVQKAPRRRPTLLVFKEIKKPIYDAESPVKVRPISSWDQKLDEQPKLLKLFKAVINAIYSARKAALDGQQSKSFRPAEFFPGLWLGSQSDTCDEKFSHLATVMDDTSIAELLRPFPESRKVFHARDDDNTDIMALFPQVRDYLDEYVKTGKPTLIHCHAGINRSATLATAYYCYKTGKTLTDAIAHMVSLRPIILRNESFLAQLTIWAVENGFAKCE